MEIITYVREGAITHQDSLGNKGRTEAGDVQVMSAGTGIRHSEYNMEPGTTRIFQIWIMPDERGQQPPSWGAKPFPKGERSGSFVALASGLPGHAEGRREHGVPHRPRPPGLPGAGQRLGADRRRDARGA
jgi:redox-sensitive bicupin YhaK (pirin superfamily)